MKVSIWQDEDYFYRFNVDDEADEERAIDLPEDTVERWERIMVAYEQMQEEMTAIRQQQLAKAARSRSK